MLRARAHGIRYTTVWMTTSKKEPVSAADARDSRRWLIGLGISVGFGLFGVVMTLLAYSERTKPTAPPAVKAASPQGAVVQPEQDVRRRRERHK